MPDTLSILGIDRSTWDYVITVPREQARAHLARLGLPGAGVHLVEDRARLLGLVAALESCATVVRASGGPVSNTLAAMAGAIGGVAGDVELHWLGLVGRGADRSDPVRSPLDCLRRLSIKPWSSGLSEHHCLTACLVDSASRETFLILVEPTSALGDDLAPFELADVVVVLLADLLAAQNGPLRAGARGQRFAVIAGDLAQTTDAQWSAMEELAQRDRIGWIFGQLDELRALRILVDGQPAAPFARTEIVATAGSAPVRVWTAASMYPAILEVPALQGGHGNDLGAGDAYAGGYLAARLRGRALDAAHADALHASALALASGTAHGEVVEAPARLIGPRAQRPGGNGREARLFETVRTTGGLTVVTGGQTGVDQIALAVGAQLGLPAFAVLPHARRTLHTDGIEDGTDDFHGARIEQLSSPSYRYRSWLTSYLGDGTMLWDFHGSEGGEAVRRACATFGRPLLDLAGIERSRRLAEARAWAERHAVRIVTVAGNRGSSLDAACEAMVREDTLALLRAIAFDRARWTAGADARPRAGEHPGAAAPLTRPLRVGVSTSGVQRALFAAFAADVYGSICPQPPNLNAHLAEPDFDVFFTRTANLPHFVRDGLLDLALCTSDVLFDTDLHALLDTGLFPLLIVTVARAAQRPRAGTIPAPPTRLASQYGQKFAALLPRNHPPVTFRAIPGTAETWLNLGEIDLALDTWSTGATAEANGLVLRDVLMSTSLVVIGTSNATGSAESSTFLRDLSRWLSGSGSRQGDGGEDG